MVFKMTLAIIKDEVTIPTKKISSQGFIQGLQSKKKNINFERYARIHLDGPKIALCETVSDTVFVLNSSFTTKNN